jgi:hypothetical protein
MSKLPYVTVCRSLRTLSLGDFTGHLFRERNLSSKDLHVQSIDTMMGTAGFKRYPESERPFTFRSAKSFSTIDYMFVRSATTLNFQVAELVPLIRDSNGC